MSRGAVALARVETLPFVSVIVPVYNDAGRLETCLRALEVQSYPARLFEVLVVDNGSVDPPVDVVARFPNARLLEEAVPASYAARARALQEASGEVLAFTDADCVPAPTWLEQGVAHLLRLPRGGLVGGRIDVAPQAARPTLYELYDRVFDFDQERFIQHGRFACTANLFTSARLAHEVGGFDPSLRSGGDRDFGHRMTAAGYDLAFAEDAVVAHPARPTLRALLGKRLRVAGGHHDLARRRRFPLLHFVAAVCYLLLRNPVVGAARIRQREPELLGSRKLAVFGLYTGLCWAELIERVRLQLGGRSRR